MAEMIDFMAHSLYVHLQLRNFFANVMLVQNTDGKMTLCKIGFLWILSFVQFDLRGFLHIRPGWATIHLLILADPS